MLAIADVAKAIVDTWSAELPDIGEAGDELSSDPSDAKEGTD